MQYVLSKITVAYSTAAYRETPKLDLVVFQSFTDYADALRHNGEIGGLTIHCGVRDYTSRSDSPVRGRSSTINEGSY
jgi:hypothetical protein